MSETIEQASEIKLRIASAIFGMVALATSYSGLHEVAFFGFPDGHITDYQRAATPALHAAFCLLAALGLFLFVVTMVSGKRTKFWRVFIFAIAMFFNILLVVQVAIPWYFGSFLALDNGIGG